MYVLRMCIVAYGNPESDKGVTYPMSPLANPVQATPEIPGDFEAWLEWAVLNKVPLKM